MDKSCINCDFNYSCDARLKGKFEPSFCQEFSINIDQDDEKGNWERAEQCKFFVPRGGDRSKVPDRERWYEKDSIA